MQLAPQTGTAQKLDVGLASARFANPLTGGTHVLVSSTAAWFAVGDDTVAASAADGSFYLPANTPTPVTAKAGQYLALVRATADGVASVAKARQV